MRTFLTLSFVAAMASTQAPQAALPRSSAPLLRLHAEPIPVVADSARSIASIQAPTMPSADRNRAPNAADVAARAARVAQRGLFFTADNSGAEWVRGRDYKARFDGSGMTFVPFLGSDAPQHYPLHFSLDAARVNGQPIALEPGRRAVRNGEQVTIERGVVDEVYELSVDHVEQTFVVGERPTSGDLELEVAVESDLRPRAAEAGGIAFANERGGVQYGAAFVREADGSRTPISSRLENGRVTLVVPEALLERASYPLVVDPIVSTFWVSGSSWNIDQVAVGVSYDPARDTAVYVSEEVFMVGDHDVYSEFFSASGTPMITAYVDFTYEDWLGPKIAHNAGLNQFMLVAEVTNSGAGQIYASRFEAGSTQWTWTGPIVMRPERLRHPDIGGDPTLGYSRYAIVFERVWTDGVDHDIEYVLADGVGNLFFGPSTALDSSFGTLDEYPRISKSNLTADWNVVWQRRMTPTDHDIHGAALRYNGTISLVPHGISIETASDDTRPVVTANLTSGHHVVAFQAYQFGVYQIGTIVLSNSTLAGSVLLCAFNPQSRIQPTIDTDGVRVLLGYSETYLGHAWDHDVYVEQLERVDGDFRCVGTRELVAGSASQELGAQVVSHGAYGGLAGRFQTAWLWDTDSYGAAYDAGTPQGPFSGLCESSTSGGSCPCSNPGTGDHGCGNSVNSSGALMSFGGLASITQDSFALSCRFMPNSAALYLQGTDAVNYGMGAVFGDGLRCVTGAVIRLGVKSNVGGQSAYPSPGDVPISIRGAITAPGTRYYQVWYRDPQSFCTTSTFNLSNGWSCVWYW